MDSFHISKICETFWLFWAFSLIGFDNGILGPCLPDLQTLVQASLGQMSYVFFVNGAGGLCGLAVGRLLEKHFNRRLLLAIYVIAGSCVSIALPLIPNFYYVLVMSGMQGITKMATEFEVMSVCNTLWTKDKAVPFQFVATGSSVATFIAPFIARPFLNDNFTSLELSVHSSDDSCQSQTFDSWNKSLSNHSKNMSFSTDFSKSFKPGIAQKSSLTDVQNSFDVSDVLNHFDVRIPFMIGGTVTLPAGAAFLYYFFRRREFSEEEEVFVFEKERLQKKEMIFKVIIILLQLPIFGFLLAFSDLLTSVAMTSPYCMTPADSSFFVVVLWGAALIGRAIAGPLTRCISLFHLLLFDTLVVFGCSLLLFLGTSQHVLILWLGMAGVGFFLTPTYPGYMVWSSEYIPLNSNFISVCLIFIAVGELLFPFLSGQLMAMCGKQSLMLLSMVIMSTMPVLTLMAYFIGRSIQKK